MTRRSKRTWLAVAILLMVCVVIVIVRGPSSGYGPQRWLAAYLRGHLTSVPDELVEAEMRQIASWDKFGVIILVDALGSSRARVAEAAAATLHEQLDRWQKLPRNRSSAPVARIAHEMAQRVDNWPHPTRCAAADLALRLLDWPTDNRQVVRGRLIADCEYVLRAHESSHTSSAPARTSVPLFPVTNKVVQETPAEIRLSAKSSEEVSPLPGGDLPVAEVELFPLPPSSDASAGPRGEAYHEPALLPSPAGSSSDVIDRPPTWLPNKPQPASPAELRSWNAPLDEPTRVTTPSDSAQDFRPERLRTLSDLDLIRSLDGNDPQGSRQVVALLQQRGFRKLDLALAHQLASPDVVTRRQLVEKVGHLSSGAARWLIWLSQDPDPLVRQATVSRMVTAQDPSVQRRLAAMEIAESDEDVREQLRRWRMTNDE
ncbi:MAG: hypothetical protein ACYC6N_29560 [Pirellulaceae bacterium]